MNKLSIVPTCFFKDAILTKLIRNLVLDGFKSYDALDELDQDALTARGIHLLGGDCEIFDNETVRSALITYMNHPGDHYDFAEAVRKHAIQQYVHIFNEMIADMIESVNDECEMEKHYEAGHRLHIDSINGEHRWI